MSLIVHAPARGVEGDDVQDDALVLGCDSVLELDGETLGKPTDAADARAWWRVMRGRSGVLHTRSLPPKTARPDSSRGPSLHRV